MVGKASRDCRGLVALAIILVILLKGLTGCADPKGGVELATVGAKCASSLADYYDSLAQDTLDTWEMEAFIRTIRGMEFDQKDAALFQGQLDALKSRASMARNLASSYDALKNLASYDASKEVKEAATNLAGAINSIPDLPKSNIVPSGLFGQVAADLVSLKQSRDIRQGSKLLLEIVEKISELFNKETPAYKGISQERKNKINTVIVFLIREKRVAAWRLLKVPDTLGLSWTQESAPVDETTQKALINVAKVRVERLALLSANAADDIGLTLDRFIENQKRFLQKQPLGLDQILAALKKAQSYLDEITKLRTDQKAK